MSETKTEEKAQEQAAGKPEQELPEFRVGFHPQKPATIVIELDLNRMNPAWARGCVLTLDDIVKSWYFEHQKAQKSRGITIASSMNSLKNMVLGRNHGR